jgi:hypothetical protein
MAVHNSQNSMTDAGMKTGFPVIPVKVLIPSHSIAGKDEHTATELLPFSRSLVYQVTKDQILMPQKFRTFKYR